MTLPQAEHLPKKLSESVILETRLDSHIAHLNVDFDTEGLRLAVPVTDVEAEDILGGLSVALAILDVEDAIRAHVLHRERRVGGDDLGTASRASCGWSRRRTFRESLSAVHYKRHHANETQIWSQADGSSQSWLKSL